MPRRLLAIALAVAPAALPAQAPTPREPIRYVVSITAPATHYADVQATFPTDGRPSIDVMMAVWTPGSYLVREFARHLQEVKAVDPAGRPLAIEKVLKNRWRVRTGGARRVVVSYRVFANERAPRLNWVNADFALLNGAPTYLTLVGGLARPHDVQLRVPSGWSRTVTPLPASRDRMANHFVAPDYDALVDSPILVGNPDLSDFTVDGKPLVLALAGDARRWDIPRAAKDLETLATQYRAFWGQLPFDRYAFVTVLAGGYDGIEHKGATGLFAPPDAMGNDTTYHYWLQLAAHEFFHAWNVKRLRPIELGPFDYEHEVYTRSLWIAEGFSDYYAWLLLARAGLASRAWALADISAAIRELQQTPGRLVQPVELASFDAWIKHYRPDDNSPNVAISYYTKGSVVGLLLDARIRRLTSGRKSLDDVMRLAYARFSGARGYRTSEFKALAAEVAGQDLSAFFRTATEQAVELDYAELLDWYGLRFDEANGGWTLVPRDDATIGQRAALDAWLGRGPSWPDESNALRRDDAVQVHHEGSSPLRGASPRRPRTSTMDAVRDCARKDGETRASTSSQSTLVEAKSLHLQSSASCAGPPQTVAPPAAPRAMLTRGAAGRGRAIG